MQIFFWLNVKWMCWYVLMCLHETWVSGLGNNESLAGKCPNPSNSTTRTCFSTFGFGLRLDAAQETLYMYFYIEDWCSGPLRDTNSQPGGWWDLKSNISRRGTRKLTWKHQHVLIPQHHMKTLGVSVVNQTVGLQCVITLLVPRSES